MVDHRHPLTVKCNSQLNPATQGRNQEFISGGGRVFFLQPLPSFLSFPFPLSFPRLEVTSQIQLKYLCERLTAVNSSHGDLVSKMISACDEFSVILSTKGV